MITKDKITVQWIEHMPGYPECVVKSPNLVIKGYIAPGASSDAEARKRIEDDLKYALMRSVYSNVMERSDALLMAAEYIENQCKMMTTPQFGQCKELLDLVKSLRDLVEEVAQ